MEMPHLRRRQGGVQTCGGIRLRRSIRFINRKINKSKNSFNQYVFALACGVREFYGGAWMKEPGKAITCCSGGLRPVYFKLEATDDEAGPFLGREQ